ncbi:ADP-ribosylglycohydrolase family protein, partial [Streptomyces sp. NPDC002920]
MLRLTWVQPEDLLGHELHQALEDGRDSHTIATRWKTAGGSEAPPRAGASPHRPSPYLRQLAEDLLDELAELPSPLAEDEPTDLVAILPSCGQSCLPQCLKGLGGPPGGTGGRWGSPR